MHKWKTNGDETDVGSTLEETGCMRLAMTVEMNKQHGKCLLTSTTNILWTNLLRKSESTRNLRKKVAPSRRELTRSIRGSRQQHRRYSLKEDGGILRELRTKFSEPEMCMLIQINILLVTFPSLMKDLMAYSDCTG